MIWLRVLPYVAALAIVLGYGEWRAYTAREHKDLELEAAKAELLETKQALRKAIAGESDESLTDSLSGR